MFTVAGVVCIVSRKITSSSVVTTQQTNQLLLLFHCTSLLLWTYSEDLVEMAVCHGPYSQS